MKDSHFHPILDQSKLDPKNEGRTGRLLSQQSCNAVRKKQLEHQLEKKKLGCFTARQKVFDSIVPGVPNEHPATLLTENDIPGLEYPVLIGRDNEAVALYKIVLGKGALGVVYLGISLDTGRQYAVKMQKYNDSKEHNREIIQETRILLEMGELADHAPLLNVDGEFRHYDIQALASGKTYFNSIYDETYHKINLEVGTLLKMALEAGLALTHLHQKGYFHGDISLSNIVWDAVLQKATLIDYGKAREIDGTGRSVAYPGGTAFYMPPELWDMDKKGKAIYSEKTEVYELGVLFILLFINRWLDLADNDIFIYFIRNPHLCGPPPPFVEAVPEIFNATKTSEHPFFSQIAPLIISMVDMDPALRPTLAQVINALDKLLKNQVLFKAQENQWLNYFQQSKQSSPEGFKLHRLITHSAPTPIQFETIAANYLL